MLNWTLLVLAFGQEFSPVVPRILPRIEIDRGIIWDVNLLGFSKFVRNCIGLCICTVMLSCDERTYYNIEDLIYVVYYMISCVTSQSLSKRYKLKIMVSERRRVEYINDILSNETALEFLIKSK